MRGSEGQTPPRSSVLRVHVHLARVLYDGLKIQGAKFQHETRSLAGRLGRLGRALAGHHRKQSKKPPRAPPWRHGPKRLPHANHTLSLSELRRSSTHTRSREKRERDSRERSLEYNPLSFEDDMAESR